MGRTKPLGEQVRTNLAKLDATSELARKRLWLTFYLSGPPKCLRTVSQALAHDGWLNTEGWEIAFLHPKCEVERTATANITVAESMRGLCEAHDTEVLGIDADTSPDVQRSKFATLYDSLS
jgi:hypothetical protein